MKKTTLEDGTSSVVLFLLNDIVDDGVEIGVYGQSFAGGNGFQNALRSFRHADGQRIHLRYFFVARRTASVGDIDFLPFLIV